jgi:hypothetical protein
MNPAHLFGGLTAKGRLPTVPLAAPTKERKRNGLEPDPSGIAYPYGIHLRFIGVAVRQPQGTLGRYPVGFLHRWMQEKTTWNLKRGTWIGRKCLASVDPVKPSNIARGGANSKAAGAGPLHGGETHPTSPHRTDAQASAHEIRGQKKARSNRFGLNPPKKEGGGDTVRTCHDQAPEAAQCEEHAGGLKPCRVLIASQSKRHPMTEV